MLFLARADGLVSVANGADYFGNGLGGEGIGEREADGGLGDFGPNSHGEQDMRWFIAASGTG